LGSRVFIGKKITEYRIFGEKFMGYETFRTDIPRYRVQKLIMFGIGINVI